MVFKVVDYGDYDVGINSYEVTVQLPCPHSDEKEWIVLCKEYLKDLYDSGTKIRVFTLEEYEIWFDN